MNGQGSPLLRPARGNCFPLMRIMIWFALVASCAAASAEPTNYRLRIVWGGQQPRLWRGAITLTNGAFSELKLLGLDADQPGSFIIQKNRILVAPRKGHRYDGLEVLASASPGDVFRVELTPDGDASARQQWEIPFAELKADSHVRTLDEQKNQLRVSRAPGDTLRVQFPDKPLVFSPGETWSIDVVPHELDLKVGASLRARLRLGTKPKHRSDMAELWNSDNDQIWSHDENLRVADDGKPAPLTGIDVRLPREEGVYELSVELAQRRGLNVPFAQLRPIAQRKIQLIVLDATAPRLSTTGQATLVTEFNPAEPRLFERLWKLPPWKQIPLTRRGPWSNKQPATWASEGKAWTRLPADGWIAYSLPITTPGVAHILDVEFPAGLAQDVGISIVEANAAGELAPIGLDSGLSMGDPDLAMPAQATNSTMVRHRLPFWPSTNSPLLLITNRQTNGSVVFGRIRLESFRQGLPLAARTKPQTRRRIAFLGRPLLAKNLLAPEALDAENQFSLEDWNTFYQAGRRLVEYLRFAGYDGAALAAACEGSALYPSKLLEPTPKYDHGIFFSSAQDPVRKDVLEMLLRLFDREGLTLIPCVEFATPLPALEQQLARDPGSSEGIELKSASGLGWFELRSNPRGSAPYYNPLDARVQNAMLDVVDELTSRYGRHASFGGIGVNMSANGYTHLPDLEWGLDHRTFSSFRGSIERHVEDAAKADFELRFRSDFNLTRSAGQHSQLQTAWLAWRTERLAQLYRDMARLVRRGSGKSLYLATAPLVKTAPWQRHLRPALPRQTTVNRAMLEIGVDAKALAREPNLIVLRPTRLAPVTQLGAQAVNLELTEEDIQNHFAGNLDSASAALFYTEPQRLRLPAFDERGPFSRAYTLLLSHFSKSGQTARQPFAHGLATRDDRLVFDGGQLLPMGQQDALRSFFDVYRQLPNRPFQSISFADETTPVVVRGLWAENQTYIYFVNDSPWPVTLSVEWDAPPGCTVESLGAHKLRDRNQVARLGNGRLALAGYDLAALRFSSENVKLRNCETELPAGVAAELFSQIDEISSRADQVEQQVKRPIPVKLLQDAGFEMPLDGGLDPAWTVSQGPGSLAEVDTDVAASGNSSMRLFSSGAAVAVTSHVFEVPQTGRLFLSVRLRTDDPNRQSPLVLRLETNDELYRPFHQFKKPLSTDFREFILRVDDVPADPSLRMKLSFELLGAGEVWIDDIRLYDKWFEPEEIVALFKILQVAYSQQKAGDLGGCYRTLSGYWPRFLLRNVLPAEGQASPANVATRPQREPAPAPAPATAKPTFLDRLKGYIPNPFR